MSRFFHGKENSNDTFRAVYAHSLMPLKREGITVLRLDHSGKDEDAGQRGASAKNDDVDAVWQLQLTGPGRLRLRRTHSRTNHGRDELVRETEVLRHVVVESTPGPTDEKRAAAPTVDDWVQLMDELGLLRDLGRDRAKTELEQHGHLISKGMAEKVVAARKARTRAAAGRGDLPAGPAATDPVGQGSRAGADSDLPADPPAEATEQEGNQHTNSLYHEGPGPLPPD